MEHFAIIVNRCHLTSAFHYTNQGPGNIKKFVRFFAVYLRILYFILKVCMYILYAPYIPDYQATMECNFEDTDLPGCQFGQHAAIGNASLVSWNILQAMPMDTLNSGPSIDSTFLTGICHSRFL